MKYFLIIAGLFMMPLLAQDKPMLPCDEYRESFPECEATGGKWLLDDWMYECECFCNEGSRFSRSSGCTIDAPIEVTRHIPAFKNERYFPKFYDPALGRDVDTPRCFTCHFVTVMEVSAAQRFDELECKIEPGRHTFPPPAPNHAEWECAFFGMVQVSAYHEKPLHLGRHVNRGSPKEVEAPYDADLVILNLGGTSYMWEPNVKKGQVIDARKHEFDEETKIEYAVYCKCPTEWAER